MMFERRCPRDIKPDDILIIWNRYGKNDEYARQFEAAGATVLIAENGYIGSDREETALRPGPVLAQRRRHVACWR